MTVNADPEPTVFEKVASSSAGRKRLEHEATMLRKAAHPGVVQLLGTDGANPPAMLRLRRASRGDLDALDVRTVEVVAGLGAALATTVADIHDLGITHGGIEPGHVLLDDDYRPLLCSFGRAQAETAAGMATRRQVDVQALAGVLIDRLPPGAPARLRRVLRTAVGGRRHISARWLARHLMTAAPNAALPGAEPSPTRSAEVAVVRRRRIAIGATLGIAAFLPVAVVTIGASGDAGPPACPAIDAGCRSMTVSGGVLAGPGGRYRLTGADGIAVLGRWDCRPISSPAVLDLATGQVWIFDRWASEGHAVAARAVGRFAGARDLRTVPASSGCDRLQVLWAHRATTVSARSLK